jgi:hypothetical protein
MLLFCHWNSPSQAQFIMIYPLAVTSSVHLMWWNILLCFFFPCKLTCSGSGDDAVGSGRTSSTQMPLTLAASLKAGPVQKGVDGGLCTPTRTSGRDGNPRKLTRQGEEHGTQTWGFWLGSALLQLPALLLRPIRCFVWSLRLKSIDLLCLTILPTRCMWCVVAGYIALILYLLFLYTRPIVFSLFPSNVYEIVVPFLVLECDAAGIVHLGASSIIL